MDDQGHIPSISVQLERSATGGSTYRPTQLSAFYRDQSGSTYPGFYDFLAIQGSTCPSQTGPKKFRPDQPTNRRSRPACQERHDRRCSHRKIIEPACFGEKTPGIGE